MTVRSQLRRRCPPLARAWPLHTPAICARRKVSFCQGGAGGMGPALAEFGSFVTVTVRNALLGGRSPSSRGAAVPGVDPV